MKARALFEMPMDLGRDPDFIDRGRRRKIERGGHPYKFSTQGLERLASEQYRQVMQKLARYTGMTPQQLQRNPMSLQQLFMQAMGHSMQVQQEHKEELEQAAVEVVLSLPEFSTARQAVDAGDLRIVARLSDEIGTAGMRVQAEEPPEEFRQQLNVPQIAQELDAEKQKRRLLNAMIQGSAINKNYAYHQVADQLNAIDPQLLRSFGLLMSFGEFMYWAMPEEAQQGMYRGGAGAAGRVQLRAGEDGVTEIHAEALVFPVLIQELSKGLMEYLSYSDEEDDDTKRYVQGQMDTLADEGWDINIGAPLWRRFLRALGDDQQLMPYVYDQIVHMPASQVEQLMRGLAEDSPEALQQIQRMVQEIKADLQESRSSRAAARVALDLLG